MSIPVENRSLRFSKNRVHDIPPSGLIETKISHSSYCLLQIVLLQKNGPEEFQSIILRYLEKFKF